MQQSSQMLHDDVIRGRRTTKEFGAEPVDPAVLRELLDAARWAPNHRMTQPWRFRVVGPHALERLMTAAGAGAEKLLRAPTLVVASYVPSPLPLHADEDMQAASCAVYAVLLAAHARGIASYWRTPGVLRTLEGRAAVGMPPGETVLGLLHFGTAPERPDAPARAPVEAYTTWLD